MLLKKILDEHSRKPNNINNVKMYSTHNEEKPVVTERFIRTTEFISM